MNDDKKQPNKVVISVVSVLVLVGVLIFAFIPNDKDDMSDKINKVQEDINLNETTESAFVTTTTEYVLTEAETVITFDNFEDQRDALLDNRDNPPKIEGIYTDLGLTYAKNVPIQMADFVNSITEDVLDFSWYKEITYNDRLASENSCSLKLEQDGKWDMALNFVSKLEGTNSIVLFRNLEFLRYVDNNRTCCICAFDDSISSTSENLVILKNVFSSEDTYEEGDIFRCLVYVDNIRLQEIDGNTVLCCTYSSDPSIS